MTDSVDTVNASADQNAIETAIQDWLDNNSTVTSVDDTEAVRVGSNRVVIIIMYTA